MFENSRIFVFQTLAALLILWPFTLKGEILVHHSKDINPNYYYNNQQYNENNLNKVSLTQKGYIQFLRYIADVPVITEFTFCIWLKSNNLTYNHPLLSYSKNENERLIRVWISPEGKEINLAILEEQVFKVPTYFRENRWYHICQSWDSQLGYWSFYLNGKMKANGYEPKAAGVKVPEGGDIVVGQEYTDSNKGLDDGIEGDIFGFNMILASTATPYEVSNNFITPYELPKKRISSANQYSHRLKQPQYQHNVLSNLPQYYSSKDQYDNRHYDKEHLDEVPSVLSYFSVGANRSPKGVYFSEYPGYTRTKRRWYPHYSHHPSRPVRVQTIDEFNSDSNRRLYSLQNNKILNSSSKIVNNYKSSLGVQLVELGFKCALGRGSPINHKKVIVSWTKTPVRVFGGAILKRVSPFCWDMIR